MASNEDGGRVVLRQSAVPFASRGLSGILRNGNNFRVGFSIHELKIIDENTRKYATIALDLFYEEVGSKFELVKTGPLKGIPTSSGKMFHMNFKAKSLDDPQDPVQLFFAELTKIDGKGIIAVCCFCFGPADSLPEKHRICCCLHCRNDHIYHPRIRWVYRCGRECQTVSDVLKGQKILKRKNESEDHNHGRSYYGHMDVDHYATYALQVYNEKKGTNFELVEGGSLGGAFLWGQIQGILVHLNFKAKNKDDPDAPMQTFFAEVIERRDVICVDYCVPIGRTDSLPGKANLRGCYSCREANVHHPPGLGYITGWEPK